ncbi:hypothetical protein SARC_03926 [Sphaeroforma arctica JP610]|uniref:Uncharacterized protein n=1 Tax=Sphaeroforma arctica JP610 TaxID=667725 RepID=A0A0L0G4L9_9EUKA|nr:hypothetical protein SARC_03926 [Sphaeroforma arctica JP610]KNC83844.1 hypothetical protein SARC_03926 [Sphaeroforma arctica JP610]|eukprot:XP_014157746.1 hypothetical protein SARC_03926 [Sphaeroforma arctica JP610]
MFRVRSPPVTDRRSDTSSAVKSTRMKSQGVQKRRVYLEAYRANRTRQHVVHAVNITPTSKPSQACLLPAQSPYVFDREVAMLCADLIFAKASARCDAFAVGLSGSYGYYLYTHRHHFNRALAFLQWSLADDPDDLSSLFVLAHLVHFQLRDLDQAEQYYTEVMESSETPFAECYIRLAMVHWQKSQFEKAQQTYESALLVVADKDRSRVLNHYANFQIVLRDYDEAITIASKVGPISNPRTHQQVVHAEPENIHAVGTLALLLLLYKNKPPEARTLFRSVLPLVTRTGPHIYGVLLVYSYAMFCALTGCQEEAKMYWRRAEELDVFPDTFEFIETYYLQGMAQALPQMPYTAANMRAFSAFQEDMGSV